MAINLVYCLYLYIIGTGESFWVVTGTTLSGELSKDVELAAQSSATVVLLMAMSKLEAIAELFTHYGKSDTPVAIIQNGTRPEAKMVTGTIKDIAYRAQYAGLANPAIIIIGEVVRLNRGIAKKELMRQVQELIN